MRNRRDNTPKPVEEVKQPVPRERYYDNYDNLMRFISYYYQVDLVKKLNLKNILEIGVGNKTVSTYLKQQGFDVTTCDINGKLKPDYIADIRTLPFSNSSYDVVLAFEVLEHLSWEDVDKALKELYRVARNNAIISIPYSAWSFELVIKSPLISWLFKRPFVRIFLGVPRCFCKNNYSSGHYWEIGRKGYPIKVIRDVIRKEFIIKNEVRPIFDSYHLFFILEKRR